MDTARFNGSCLCGEVMYEVEPPFLFFQYCHCSRCRKATGTAHAANILVKVGQFKWTAGESLVKRFELPKAEYFCTGFCAVCGSSMPWISKTGKYFLVPSGTLDDDPQERPQRNIFWADRAPWYREASVLPTFDRGPERASNGS